LDKKIVAEHYQTHTITEIEHIPEHGERKETLEFRNAKHELESIEHLGCFICGSMEKRESHHIFERCWGNAFDFELVAMALYKFFDFEGHVKRDFKNPGELLDWFMKHFNGHKETVEYVDELGETVTKSIVVCDDDALDSLYNQIILCENHHRTAGHSAHGSTFATFTGMFATKPGFHNALSSKEYQDILDKHHEEKHGK
jgi:hypothetical protein